MLDDGNSRKKKQKFQVKFEKYFKNKPGAENLKNTQFCV